MKKQKTLLKLWAILLLISTMLIPQEVWAAGTQPSTDSNGVYLIASKDNLIWFRDAVNGGNNSINGKLTKSFEVGNQTSWIGIGTSSKKYTGTFDGNGQTLTMGDLTAQSAYSGLFGYINGATIKNFTIKGTVIETSYDGLGSVVGYAEGASQILDIKSEYKVKVNGAKKHIGGIVGYITGSTKVSGCSYSGTIDAGSSSDSNGGIVGYSAANSGCVISYCWFSGTIVTTASKPTVGGILGYVNDETSGTFGGVKYCFHNGTLPSSSDKSWVAAFIGQPRGSAVRDANVQYNYYLEGKADKMVGNGKTASGTYNKAISISVTAGSNGSVSKSYVNPTSTSATKLQVVATPNDHYHFGSWSDSGAQTHAVGLTDDVNLTATFAIDQHKITLAKYGNYNYRCKLYVNGTESTGGTYDYNTELTIKAVPDTYCYFKAWQNEGTDVSSEAEFSYTVTGDATLTAVCYKNSYTLTLEANNKNWGTVSGGGKCDAYNDVSISATPAAHYHFVNWTKDGSVVSSSASCSYRAHGDEKLVANFAIDQHTITVSSNNTNYGTVLGGGTYDYDKEVSLTATAKDGYHFVKWNDDNTDASRKVTVKANDTYTATFAAHRYTAQSDDDAYLKSAATCTADAVYYHKCSGCSAKGTTTWTKTGTGGHTFNDATDPNHTVCTRSGCGHTILRYTATSEVTPKNGNFYDKDGNTLTYTRTFDSKTGEGEIEFDGVLTSIGNYAFQNRSSLTNVTIPNSVTSIGNYAFQNCSSLASITIPNSVTSIGGDAFYDCTNLTSVTIPNSVSSIGNYAFKNCSKLTNVTIPNSVTRIGGSTFQGCSSLESVTIPNSVTSIGSSAFAGCAQLSSISIPNSVSSIGNYAFEKCTSLTTVTIPNSVSSIGDYAFYYCSSLNSITIPNSVTSIGFSAFAGCAQLSSISIPNSVSSIGNYAFSGCSKLANVTIPNSVTSIGYYAFQYCTSLKSITIPNSVTNIGNCAFEDCSKLNSVEFQSIPKVGYNAFSNVPSSCQYTLALSDGSYVAADKDCFPTLTAEPTYTHTMAAESQWGTVVLPFEAKSDDKLQLYQISSIADGKVTLAEAETVAAGTPCLFKKKNAAATSVIFTANSKDVSVATPTATTFGDLMLTGAYASQPVSASAGYVLEGNQFKQTTADTEVSPFQAYLSGSIDGVSALKIVDPGQILRYTATSKVSPNNGNFYDKDGNTLSYTSTFDSETGKGEIEFNGVLTSIGDNAFSDCSSLTSVTIPNSVTSIGVCAFMYCSSLTNVTIPNSVTSIGGSAFQNCSKLTSVSIPSSVTSIEDAIFSDCSSLKSISIPSSVTSIGEGVFQNCSSLNSISIPNSVTSIGGAAFFNCSKLTNVSIPNSVTSIGDYAFSDCSNLTNVNIPNSVTCIEVNTFHNCTRLTNVTIPSSVTSIEYYAFYGCTQLSSVKFQSVPEVGYDAFYNVPSRCKYTLALSDDSYVAADKDCFPTLSAEPTYTHTMAAESQWGTVVLPFEAKSDDKVQLYQISTIADGKVTLAEAETVAAGTPCLFKKKNAAATSVIFTANSEAISVATPTSTTIGTLDLTGAYASQPVNATAGYVLEGNQFKQTTADTEVSSFQAYLSGSIDGVSALKIVVLGHTYLFYTATEKVTPYNGNFYDKDNNKLTYTNTFDSETGKGEFEFNGVLTSIEDYAFQDCSSLTNVTIPSSVTSIGYVAFAGCSSLASITIPNSVTSIGDDAFRHCCVLEKNYVNNSGLEAKGLIIADSEQNDGLMIKGSEAVFCRRWATSVTIPNSVTSIGNFAFYDCTKLTTVTIPNSVTSIGNYAFGYCYKLASVTIPNSVTSIGEYAFNYCYNLTTVTIPNSVTSIGRSAFENCSKLTNVTIPNSVTSIEYQVFYGCSSLESISIPNSVTSIGISAFQNCYKLASVTIPSSVTSIGDQAFLHCNELESVTIPSSVTSIGGAAFADCSKLNSVEFQSIPKVDSYAFYNVPSSCQYTLALSDDSYVAADKGYFPTLSAEPTYTHAMAAESQWGTVVLPFEAKSDDKVQLYQISSIADGKITLAEAETVAAGTPCLFKKKNADATGVIFTANSEVISVATPTATTFGTLDLTGAYASQPVSASAGYVLEGNLFKQTTADTEVSPFQAYLSGSIDGVSALKILNPGHTYLFYTATSEVTPHNGNFYDKDGNKLSYTNTFDSKTGEGEIEFDGVLTSIGNYAFENCSSLTNVTIPNSVTSIGDVAFCGCSSLASITIPNSVTSIGNYAFENCSKLTNVTIPNSVTSIGNYDFSNCSKLTSVTIPNSVKSIGNYAFENCSSLSSVKFQSIPEVYYNAFDEVPSTCKYTLALSDDSYVTADKGYFPTLSAEPTYRREMSTQWGTIVVPFAVTIDAKEPYDFYELESLNGDVLSLKKVTGTLAAGTPVLIRMSGAAKNAEGKYILSLTAADKSVDTALSDGSKADGLTLTGAYAKKVLTTESGYIINNNSFWSLAKLHEDYPTSEISIGAFRAYLASSTSGGAAQLRISAEEATALEVLDSLSSGEGWGEAIYDLSGRKQDDLREGVNIIKKGNKSVKIVIK